MSDPLGPLRKLDFPRCAQAGLDRISNSFKQVDSGIPGLGGEAEELAEQVTRELIFCEPHGRHRGIRNFSALQELQLLEVLTKCFQNSSYSVSVRQSIFKALFGSALEGRRKSIFYKLVSMAIGVKCVGFLDCVAIWMQRQGCHTDPVLQLAEGLVQDYCQLVPGASCTLRSLPKLSQHFTCNFITALTNIYTPFGGNTTQKMLPCSMLELLTDWLQDDPRLCLSSLSHGGGSAYLRNSLWTSPTKPNNQTPIPGLVRWGTQAPLLMLGAPSNGLETEQMLWSKLHLYILQTFTSFHNMPGANQLELLTLADMNRIVRETGSLVKEKNVTETGDDASALSCKNAVNTSLERLVQILQVSMATGGFRCSLSDLQTICNSVPTNRLLDILQCQHLNRAPQPMHFESR